MGRKKRINSKETLNIWLRKIEDHFKDIHENGSEDRLSEDRLRESLGDDLLEKLQKVLKGKKSNDEDVKIGDSYHMLLDYFDLDTWDENEGLLLLAGIYPGGANVEFGVENYAGEKSKEAKIRLAKILDFSGHFEFYPEQQTTLSDLRELETKLRGAKADKLPESKIALIQAELNKFEDVFMTSDVKVVWAITNRYSYNLSEIYRHWLASIHPEGKLSAEYFINWAIEKEFEIGWLNWAQDKGYFIDIDNVGKTNISDVSSNILKELQNQIDLIINKYPAWRDQIGIENIQNSENLMAWIKEHTLAKTREAEIIKKGLLERFPELKKR
jgi:hypothetical protein